MELHLFHLLIINIFEQDTILFARHIHLARLSSTLQDNHYKYEVQRYMFPYRYDIF